MPQITLRTLRNAAGMTVTVTSYGGAMTPSTVLRPDEEHRTRTIFRYSAGKADV